MYTLSACHLELTTTHCRVLDQRIKNQMFGKIIEPTMARTTQREIACIQLHHALPTFSVTHPFTERLTIRVDAVCRLFDCSFFSGRSGNGQYSSAVRLERIVNSFVVIEDQHFVAPGFIAKGLFSRVHHNMQTRLTKHACYRVVARLQTT